MAFKDLINHSWQAEPQKLLRDAPNTTRSSAQLWLAKSLNAVCANKDGTYAIVGGREILQLITYDANANELLVKNNLRRGRSNLDHSCNDIAWQTIGSEHVATGAASGSVVLWDVNIAEKGPINRTVLEAQGRAINTVTFSPTRATELLAGGQGGICTLWDIRGPSASAAFKTRDPIRKLAYSPSTDGVHFAAALESGEVHIFDVRQERPLHRFKSHQGPCYAVAWHPTTKGRLASGGRDQSIRILDVENPTSYDRRLFSIASVQQVLWRPLFKDHLASCAFINDPIINVWNLSRPYFPTLQLHRPRDMRPTPSTPAAAASIGEPVSGFLWGQDGRDDGLVVRHSISSGYEPRHELEAQCAGFAWGADLAFATFKGNQPAAAAAAKSTVKRRSLLRDRVTVADTTPKQMAESMIEVTVPVPPETAPPPATMRPSATSSSHAVPANAKAASSQRHAHSQNKNGSQSSLHPTSDKPNRLGCLEMSQAAQKLLLSEQERLAALRYLACNYVLKGYERRELCKRNAAVARAVEREDLALTWEALAACLLVTAVSPPRQSSMANLNSTSAAPTAPTEQPREPEQANPTMLHEAESSRDIVVSDLKEEDSPFRRLEGGNIWQQKMSLRVEKRNHSLKRHTNFSVPGSEGFFVPEILARNTGSRIVNHNEVQQDFPVGSILSATLCFYADQGDVQMCSHLLVVFGNQVDEGFEPALQRQCIMAYGEQLMQLGMSLQRTAILKASTLEELRDLNPPAMGQECLTCVGPKGATTIPAGGVCPLCRLPSICAICHQVVRGIASWCQACAHGGHQECMREWFAKENFCPTGCNHCCRPDLINDRVAMA
ncbi:uncharacterized protein MONBRDRAFT_34454 [Monosiga brevicollis MX1]|uniref:WDR59/RTC1-like RING zinc finger domain-containing protein n=1 Tax=Monosiga brevicollis TaxID=81824 RepID=A9VBV5_MONBE|nr:uncharacterized protein MONBRDRAFT_34454 [Monosiga brevicollis MX1]EDQ84999.1 predicted protein [Monosiga brevicollis MX1]|eukprot:XP_001750169.1 hypothetical protein [Monosiga brevicollis MX1]